MKHRYKLFGISLMLVVGTVAAQVSQRNKIQGNTEINVATENTTAIAVGENNVAKNRVGVVQGNKQGNTKDHCQRRQRNDRCGWA
jgi:adenosine/AMP kinase